MQYRPKGVCSQSIDFDIEDNKVKTSHLSADAAEIFREFPV